MSSPQPLGPCMSDDRARCLVQAPPNGWLDHTAEPAGALFLSAPGDSILERIPSPGAALGGVQASDRGRERRRPRRAAQDAGMRTTRYYRDGIPFVTLYGSRNYRNNNPGNLRYESLEDARTHGALNIGDGGFAIFPSYETGAEAQLDLLRKKYGNSSISGMIDSYARSRDLPKEANDRAVRRYKNVIDTYLRNEAPRNPTTQTSPGLPTVIKDLTIEQLKGLRGAMEKHEGFSNPSNSQVTHPIGP
jgi:hypothetical protein